MRFVDFLPNDDRSLSEAALQGQAEQS
jgi:hypothetical protein